MVLRLGPAQRFEVPVVEVLTSQRRLQLWIVVGHVGLVVTMVVDAVFFGNFLALEYGAGEVYAGAFSFYLLYVHIIKLPLLVFTTYALGRSRVSFGVTTLQAAFIANLAVFVADLATLIILVVEIIGCTSSYCYREAGDGIGEPGTATLQFYVLLFAVVGSLVMRAATAIAISFLNRRIRTRNTAALENMAQNRNPTDPLSGVAGVRTVTAIDAQLAPNGDAAAAQNHDYRPAAVPGHVPIAQHAPSDETRLGLRFYDSDSDDDDDGERGAAPLIPLDHRNVVVHAATRYTDSKGRQTVVMPVTLFSPNKRHSSKRGAKLAAPAKRK